MGDRLRGRRPAIAHALRTGTYREWLIASTAEVSKTVENDSTTPASFLFPLGVSESWTHYHRLWASVLVRAIYDVVHYRLDPNKENKVLPSHEQIGREAYNWFLRKRKDIGSFLWICSILEIIDPDVVTERVLSLQREDLPRQCSSHRKR